MWENTAKTPVYDKVDRDIFENQILPGNRPAILKGYVKHWRALALAEQSPAALCNYLQQFAQPTQVQAWYGEPGMQGRFFYSDDIIGRNFDTRHMAIAELFSDILATQDQPQARHIFAGGVNLSQHLPGLLAELPLGLIDNTNHLTSLWIGNRTRTAAHWDLPQNLACVIAGTRRFTLFPNHQIGNLYIGPIDNTLAGQPISLVDFANPDFTQFPRFKDAMAHAEVAELEAGDVLYMPSMWVHHVESLDNFGAMINFWWRAGPKHLPTPLFTLFHAFLTLREMPEQERQAWKVLFDQYIFAANGQENAHIPPAARGLLGEITPEMKQGLKNFIAQSLNN